MIRFIATRQFQVILCLAILLGAVMLRITEPRWVEQLQAATFDTYNRIAPRPSDPQLSPIVIVDIDDPSLGRLGQWPWPRTEIARMVRALSDYGVAAIAFDIVFAEPDRTSPAQVAARLADSGQIASDAVGVLTQLPDHDLVLAEAIAEAGNVVTGFVINPVGLGGVPKRHFGWAMSGDGEPQRMVRAQRGSIVNIDPLQEAAAGNGNFNIFADRDTLVRRVPLVIGHVDEERQVEVFPSLSIESLRVAARAGSAIIFSDESLGITRIRVARQDVPTDADGQAYVYYSGHQPERYVSAWEVIERQADPNRFRGRIALIGTSAPGLLDLRSTPLDGSIAGVEVHAEMIEQIVAGQFLQRPFWVDTWLEPAFIVVVGLLLVLSAPFVGALRQALIVLVLIAGAVGFSWYAFSVEGQLVDPVYPSLSVILVYMASSLIGFVKTEYERGVVRDAFSRYIAPDLVEDLAKNPDSLRLGGEVKDLSIMFTDIRGFTSISEQYDPESLTKLINDFLTPMSALVLEYKGCIDKYMGDAMMAFWNAPIDDPDHAKNAIDAGLQMMAALEPLNARLKEEAEAAGRQYLPLKTGIGINTGPCCVGNMGSEQRFAYSALGDAVNLASRLEGQTKGYGVDVLIGELTAALVPDYALVECDMIRVKGKLEPVTVFAVLGRPDTAQEAWFREHRKHHQQMLDCYRAQHWDAAEEAMEEAEALVPGGKLNTLYALYRERIAEYRAAPPPADWDGVFVATSK